jgi:hypothetical protein
MDCRWPWYSNTNRPEAFKSSGKTPWSPWFIAPSAPAHVHARSDGKFSRGLALASISLPACSYVISAGLVWRFRPHTILTYYTLILLSLWWAAGNSEIVDCFVTWACFSSTCHDTRRCMTEAYCWSKEWRHHLSMLTRNHNGNSGWGIKPKCFIMCKCEGHGTLSSLRICPSTVLLYRCVSLWKCI